jgi:myo-inositol-1(or 4)-monophosphatase
MGLWCRLFKLTLNTKNGGASLAAQVVTEVDHLSQDIILKTLHPSCLIYDLALLSEESPDDNQRLQKDYFWCIDPLDGTLPFIESVPGYSVSIALVSREGQSMLGVVYDPVTQTLYHAIQGQGLGKTLKYSLLRPRHHRLARR